MELSTASCEPGERDDMDGNGPDAHRRGLIDPRTDPKPRAADIQGRTVGHPNEIDGLLELCKKGRVYSVERWISEGRPLQARYRNVWPWQRVETPLVVAIETGQFDLTLLLLCNGYRTELEPRSILDLVLERRAWDFLELVLEWGVDPTKADPEIVLDTYQSQLMERFWDYGVDFTGDHTLAQYLSSSTRNKPAYGFARRHREDPGVAYDLALALVDAVEDNREKAVSLLMWAGADPHRSVPSLKYGSGVEDDPDDDRETAIEAVVHMGYGELLRHLKPNPAVDDFDEIYNWVCDPDSVDFLFDLKPPDDWSRAIVRNASRMSWWSRGRRKSRECLQRIFEHYWGRLNVLEHDDCQHLRRDLLKIENDGDLSWLLEKLAKPQHCDEVLFAELTRTQAIRKRMERLRLSALLPEARSKREATKSAPSKRQSKRMDSHAHHNYRWLDNLDPEDREEVLRGLISREQLYEEVWSAPAAKVARRYGVSDVAVAKWCKKLDVPKPERGYWARKEAGYNVKKKRLPPPTNDQQRYVIRPKTGAKGRPPSAKIPGLELFEKPIPALESVVDEHILVARTRRALDGATVDECGILHPSDLEVLDVMVGEKSVDRALRIMNSLIRALENADFAVEVSGVRDSDSSPGCFRTNAIIRSERISFSLTEKTVSEARAPTAEERAEMRKAPWKKGPFHRCRPTGELTIRIDRDNYRERHRCTWADSKESRLEDHLYSIVRTLLISADARIRHRSGTYSS